MVASRRLTSGLRMALFAAAAGLLGASTAALSSSPLPMIALTLAAVIYLIVQIPGAWHVEIALLGIVVLCCTVIDIDTLPMLPIGIGSLNPADLLLLALGGLIIFRCALQPSARVIRPQVTAPLLVFFALIILSVINALVTESGTRHRILSELRTLTFLLLAVIVPQLIVTRQQFRRVVRGLTGLAVICAILMLAQSFLGPSAALIPERLVSVNSGIYAETGLFRVTPPAQALIRTTLILLAAEWLLTPQQERPRWLIPGILLMVLGLLVTSNRNYWLGTIISLALAASLIDSRRRYEALSAGIRTVILIAVAVLVLILILDLLNIPAARQLIDTTLLRLDPDSSVANVESTLATRQEELYYIERALADHPLIGIGLGANYQPMRWYESPAFNHMYYTHNAYLWILMKMGFTGLLAFVWLIVAFVRQSLTQFQKAESTLARSVMLASGTLIIGLLFSAPFSPIFMEWFWTPLIGLCIGLSEAALHLER